MKRICVAVFAALLIAFGLSLYPQAAMSQSSSTVVYDVACDGNTFILNRNNSTASEIRRGDTFVLNGKIYPGNTIPKGGTRSQPSSFGPGEPGSIGTWFCRGTFLVGSERFKTEKIQRATTHYFALDGKNRLMTEGFEGSVSITRVILGGIGEYAGVNGFVTMERIGINATGAYNMRFTFDLN